MPKRENPKKRRRPAARRGSRGSHRPLLSLAMIVRNEQEFLEGALESARGKVDEIVVVDTGSTDRTVEIAESMGARVFRFAWTDSFSEARNESLRHVTGRWVVILDADERLVGDGWNELRAHLASTSEPGGYALLLVNATLSGRAMKSFYPARVFPNDGSLVFRGRVHNRPERRDRVGAPYPHRAFAGPQIVHYGYDFDVYARREKAKRSLPLIEAELAERPDDLLYRYYRARELLAVRRTEARSDELQASRRELEELVDAILAAGRGPLLEAVQQLFTVYEHLEVGPAAVELCRRLGQTVTEHPDLEMGLAQSHARMGAYQEAIASAREVLQLLSHPPRGEEAIRYRPWAVHELIGRCELERGQPSSALSALLEAVRAKRDDDHGWHELLTVVADLAVRLGHRELAESVLLTQVCRADCQPDPFFEEVERRFREESSASGAELLKRGLRAAPHLVQAPQLSNLRLAGR